MGLSSSSKIDSIVPNDRPDNIRTVSLRFDLATSRDEPPTPIYEAIGSISNTMERFRTIIHNNVRYSSPFCCCSLPPTEHKTCWRDLLEKFCLFVPTVTQDEVNLYLLFNNDGDGVVEQAELIRVRDVVEEVEYRSGVCCFVLTPGDLQRCYWGVFRRLFCYKPVRFTKIYAVFDVNNYQRLVQEQRRR